MNCGRRRQRRPVLAQADENVENFNDVSDEMGALAFAPCGAGWFIANTRRSGWFISAGLEASWRSGYAEDCKSLHAGSIPGEASKLPMTAQSPVQPFRFALAACDRTAAANLCVRAMRSAQP